MHYARKSKQKLKSTGDKKDIKLTTSYLKVAI